MKFRPCPKCKSTDIKIRNCGYTTFDPWTVECQECGFNIEVMDAGNSHMIKIWNESKTLIGLQKLKQKLTDKGFSHFKVDGVRFFS